MYVQKQVRHDIIIIIIIKIHTLFLRDFALESRLLNSKLDTVRPTETRNSSHFGLLCLPSNITRLHHILGKVKK